MVYTPRKAAPWLSLLLDRDEQAFVAHTAEIEDIQDEKLREETIDGDIFASLAGGDRSYRQARDLMRMKKTARRLTRRSSHSNVGSPRRSR